MTTTQAKARKQHTKPKTQTKSKNLTFTVSKSNLLNPQCKNKKTSLGQTNKPTTFPQTKTKHR